MIRSYLSYNTKYEFEFKTKKEPSFVKCLTLHGVL